MSGAGVVRKKRESKAAMAALPTWVQVVALGLFHAEGALELLTIERSRDADWSSEDWDCDTSIDLALVAVRNLRTKKYEEVSDFECDWYQVAGVVSLAKRGFSGRNSYYANCLDSLSKLMEVVPEMVEYAGVRDLYVDKPAD